MLQILIDCKSLENSQEKIPDTICFSNVESLQLTDRISTLNRLHHRFFRNIFRKRSLG